MKRNGFTLVEMLVALGIFALLAAASVGVLRSSVDVQASVDTRLTAIGGIARLNALMSADLGQAVDRPSRSASGQRPAFLGDSSGMEFVSAENGCLTEPRAPNSSGSNGDPPAPPCSEPVSPPSMAATEALPRRWLATSGAPPFVTGCRRDLELVVFIVRTTAASGGGRVDDDADGRRSDHHGLCPASGRLALEPKQVPTGGPTPDQLPPSERGA